MQIRSLFGVEGHLGAEGEVVVADGQMIREVERDATCLKGKITADGKTAMVTVTKAVTRVMAIKEMAAT